MFGQFEFTRGIEKPTDYRQESHHRPGNAPAAHGVRLVQNSGNPKRQTCNPSHVQPNRRVCFTETGFGSASTYCDSRL